MNTRLGRFLSSAFLLAVGAVVPLLVAAHYGALRVPRSDDWSYLHTLFAFADHGRWSFNDWGSMTLVGQILLAAPVAKVAPGSIAAARVLTAFVGAGGLLAVVALGVRLGVRRDRAFLVALLLAVSPLWSPLASTFMTDVWLFTFQTLALAALARSLRHATLDRTAFALAVVAAVVGVAIRQYGAVTFVAVVGAALLATRRHDDRAGRRFVLLAAAAAVVVIAVVFVGWARIPHRLVLAPHVPTTRSIHKFVTGAAGFLRLAGLCTAPLVLLAGPRAIVRRARDRAGDLAVLVGVAAAGFLGFSYLIGTDAPFVGNYFDRRGVLADDIIFGNRPLVMPAAVFEVLVLVGSVAALLLVMAVLPAVLDGWARVRARDVAAADPLVTACGVVVVGTYGTYCLAILAGLPSFDRYALGAIPLVGLLVARDAPGAAAAEQATGRANAPRLAGPAAVALTGAFAFVGLVFATESASFDATRWNVAVAATRHGFAVGDVNEGYEWSGWNRGIAPPYLPADTDAVRKQKRERYERGNCVNVVIVDSPVRPTGAIAVGRTTGWLRDDAWITARAIAGKRCGSGVANPADR